MEGKLALDLSCAVAPKQADGDTRAATGPPADACRDAARRLCQLSEQFEEFSLEQLQRLEQVLAQCDEILQQETMLREMMTSVQEERTRWEQQRQKELRRMQDETTRLLEAWKQLENEQRRLLAHRPGLPRDASARRGDAEFRPAELGSTPRSVPADTTASSGVASERANECHHNAGPVNFDSALLQFQQLRRELQKHALHRDPAKRQ